MRKRKREGMGRGGTGLRWKSERKGWRRCENEIERGTREGEREREE